jgi:anti-anti-sigma factor
VKDDLLHGVNAPAVLGVERIDGVTVVRLGGELDLHNAEQVRAAVPEASGDGSARVVVDLSQVEFIDSTALGVLIEARARLGRGLVVAGPQLATRRTLQVSGVDRHLPVHGSVAEALEALAG